MYSDMSTRIRADWSPKRNSVKRRATSVLPTPLGPRKTKEPMGRLGSRSPARLRRMAFETALRASSWPMTHLRSSSSMRSSFSVSSSSTSETGMPVISAMTWQMSFSSTTVCGSDWPSLQFFLRSCNCFFRDFSSSRKEAAFSNSWLWMADSFSVMISPIFFSRSRRSGGTTVMLRRARLPASSMMSMALSGRARPEM
jgi:hypothetical protein